MGNFKSRNSRGICHPSLCSEDLDTRPRFVTSLFVEKGTFVGIQELAICKNIIAQDSEGLKMLSHNATVEGKTGEGDEDARSLAREFWALLNAGSPEEASDIARRIAPTPVGSFSFPDAGETGVARGTSAGDAPLDAGTPGVVADAWNSERKVSLLQANPKWCRAPIASGPRARRISRCAQLRVA